MQLSNLENKIGSALLAKAAATKLEATKDQYDSLDDIDRQILALCATPATDSRIKQFFTARDADNKTCNIDHKIQLLMRQGFLGRGANKYVLNPEYREFITVMPMTASIKEADEFSEDVLGSGLPAEVVYEIKELVLANELTLEVIAESLAEKHNLDEEDIYAVAEALDKTGSAKDAAGDDFAELTKDVLFSEEIPRDVADEIRELVTANELSLEVIAEEIADKYDLDEDDVLAAAQKMERAGTVKKSFSLKKKTKVAEFDLSFSALVELPVLREGHSSDLKIDDGKTRVWLLRTGEGIEGYGGFHSGYLIERLTDGRWEEVDVKRNIDPSAHIGEKIAINKADIFKELDSHEWGSILEAQDALAEKFNITDDEFTTIYNEWLDTPKQATDIGLGMGIVDRTEREEMRESLIGNKVAFDESAVEDAELFMGNDPHFHSTHFEPAVKTITNFKGTEQGTDLLFYDIIKDVVEAGLKEYSRSDKWEQHDFTEQDREQLIKNMLEYIDTEYALGNLDIYKESKKLSEKEIHTAKRKLANKKAAASLGGTTSFTFNKHTLPNKAIQFTRKFLSSYRFPIAPDLNYTAVRNASTDDYNNTIDGEALVTVNFKTISGVKKSADIVVPIRGGQLLEPSTFQVDGVSYIISQSAIDNIIKSATFYNKPAVGDVFSNPLDKFTKAKLDKSKLPTYNRGMFSI